MIDYTPKGVVVVVTVAPTKVLVEVVKENGIPLRNIIIILISQM